MEKLVIIHTLSPGDYVVLSAAVRDIGICYPEKYQIMVSTPLNCIFENNPNLKEFEIDKKTRIVEAKYSEGPYCVNNSNKQQVHFLWGFLGSLNETLGIKAHLTDFKPDLHLSNVEKDKPLIAPPYWLFSSGGKTDFTTKWWDPQCYQEVVNEMSKWVKMVQVGHKSHVHPNINNTQNLVGKTSLRDLMRLIYHAEGVICPITCIMHIAAAFNKPCVVVAGGREHWW
jgi:ADP-heptose:LPS heptosyltransferase